MLIVDVDFILFQRKTIIYMNTEFITTTAKRFTKFIQNYIKELLGYVQESTEQSATAKRSFSVFAKVQLQLS